MGERGQFFPFGFQIIIALLPKEEAVNESSDMVK